MHLLKVDPILITILLIQIFVDLSHIIDIPALRLSNHSFAARHMREAGSPDAGPLLHQLEPRIVAGGAKVPRVVDQFGPADSLPHVYQISSSTS